MNRKAALGAVVLLVLAAVLPWLWPEPETPAEPVAPPQPDLAAGDLAATLPAPAPPPADPSKVIDDADRAFAERVRAKFAAHMGDRHARIKAIEQVVAYLMQRYPDDWRWRVKALLEALFPELAEELYASFEKLMRLNEWLGANRERLMQLPPAERRAALWQARHDEFGDEAEQIWAAERRNEKVGEALAALEQAQGKTTDEKIAMFVGAVNEVYGEKAPEVLERSGTELMNRFLEVKSVQQDLAAMPRAEQHAALRRVRSAIGLDEEALQRWDALDAERDAAWDRGQSYMLQRNALIAQYGGEEQQRRLAELRQQVFGAEAEIIASEEAAGFFRFGNQRRIGRE